MASTERPEDKRRKRLLLMLALLIPEIGQSITDQAASAARGETSPARFGNWVRQSLLEGHTQAAFIGRQLAGNLEPLGLPDVAFGDSVVSEQGRFLHEFQRDIENGKYRREDGGIMEIALGRRAQMYALRLRGTVNEAFARALPPETVMIWIMGETEEHCADCPRIAAAGPYTAQTLPTYPGAGDTECLVNCLCHLETSSGLAGPKRSEV